MRQQGCECEVRLTWPVFTRVTGSNMRLPLSGQKYADGASTTRLVSGKSLPLLGDRPNTIGDG